MKLTRTLLSDSDKVRWTGISLKWKINHPGALVFSSRTNLCFDSTFFQLNTNFRRNARKYTSFLDQRVLLHKSFTNGGNIRKIERRGNCFNRINVRTFLLLNTADTRSSFTLASREISFESNRVPWHENQIQGEKCIVIFDISQVRDRDTDRDSEAITRAKRRAEKGIRKLRDSGYKRVEGREISVPIARSCSAINRGRPWYQSTVEISKIIGMTRHEIAPVEWMRGEERERERGERS